MDDREPAPSLASAGVVYALRLAKAALLALEYRTGRDAQLDRNRS